MISGVGHWRMAETAAKLSGEMSIVAKAAGVGDLADGLACIQQSPAMQLTRGMIQTDRTFYLVQQGIASVEDVDTAMGERAIEPDLSVWRRRAKATCGDPLRPSARPRSRVDQSACPQRPDSRLQGRALV